MLTENAPKEKRTWIYSQRTYENMAIDPGEEVPTP